MIDICEACGQPLPIGGLVKKDRWTYRETPPEIYYQGLRVPCSQAQSEILILLVKRQSVSYDGFLMATMGGESTFGSLKSQISELKKLLPSGVKIKNIWKFGYALTDDRINP